jgi:hypothetical protein
MGSQPADVKIAIYASAGIRTIEAGLRQREESVAGLIESLNTDLDNYADALASTEPSHHEPGKDDF